VLSHAHLDHCGWIPYLYDQGFKGPLYCTSPTRDMLTLLCLDYIDVCHKNGREAYPKKAVEKTIKHSIALDYGEVSDITSDMRLTFQPSGHLLGSSLVHLHVGEGLHNILYTGDLKFGPSRLFEAAYTDFSRAETIIIESTYGASKDNLPPRRDAEEKLMQMIDATVKQGGKVLIPSFAVGRGQEIMAILAAREFQYPVYIEGMIWDATAIHTAYPENLNHYVQRDIFHRGKNPFLYEKFHRVVPKERNGIIDNGEPGVIIATSGMLIGGPAIEYLRGLATGRKNTLLFVGYQGEGTPGRRIQKGWREVPFYGNGGKTQTLRIDMNVDTVSGLTGHSDRSQLMSYLHKIRARPDRIIVQHGEASKCLEFARDAHRSFRTEAIAPKNLESVRLN
jgi:predicted metal-dependent RNase